MRLLPASPLAALLLASSAALAQPACPPARSPASSATLPAPWRAALDELVRSTREPGHPWSCGGGEVELSVSADGATLRVAREGEPLVSRRVASPDDVVPLGQALLARPVAIPPPAPEPPAPPAPAPSASSATPAPQGEPAPPDPPPAPSSADRREPRLLVAVGPDARRVGGSSVTWVGAAAQAAVPLGRWLPAVSLRYQTDVGPGRGHLDDVAMALTMMARFGLSRGELRPGLRLAGAVVSRDISRKQGDQTRLDGRLGAVVAFAWPLWGWASLVLSADGEVVVTSREVGNPDLSSDTPRAFPTHTIGGAALFEVSL